MTTGTLIHQGHMTTRKFARIKELFVAPPLESDDGGETDGKGKEADQKARQPPRLYPVVKAKVTLELVGDLLLRSSPGSHGSVIEKGDHRVPRSEKNEEEGERHVDKEPAMQPMVQAELKIEHPTFVAPALNFLDSRAIRLRHT